MKGLTMRYLFLLMCLGGMSILFFQSRSSTNAQKHLLNVNTSNVFIVGDIKNKQECILLLNKFSFVCITITGYCSIYLSDCPPPLGISLSSRNFSLASFSSKEFIPKVDTTKIEYLCNFTCPTLGDASCHKNNKFRYYAFSRTKESERYNPFNRTEECDYAFVHLHRRPVGNSLSPYFFAIGYAALNRLNLCVYFDDTAVRISPILLYLPHFFPFRTDYLDYDITTKLGPTETYTANNSNWLKNIDFTGDEIFTDISEVYARENACHCEQPVYTHECFSGWPEIINLIPTILETGLSAYATHLSYHNDTYNFGLSRDKWESIRATRNFLQNHYYSGMVMGSIYANHTNPFSEIAVVHSRCAWETVYGNRMYGLSSFSLFNSIAAHKNEISSVLFIDGQRGQVWLCEVVRILIFTHIKDITGNNDLKRFVVNPNDGTLLDFTESHQLLEKMLIPLIKSVKNPSNTKGLKDDFTIVLRKFQEKFGKLAASLPSENKNFDAILVDLVRMIRAPVLFRTTGTFSLWAGLGKSTGIVYSPPTPKEWKWNLSMPYLSPRFKWVPRAKILTGKFATDELKILGINWKNDYVRIALPWLYHN